MPTNKSKETFTERVARLLALGWIFYPGQLDEHGEPINGELPRPVPTSEKEADQ